MGMPRWRKRNTERGRQLRREATPAERALWRELSNNKLGRYKFSRQMQIGPFYCDLLCRQERLAIELDGFSHDVQPGRDKWRNPIPDEYGIRVLHFTDEDVFKYMEGVLVEIGRALAAGPAPTPPASGRGES